MDAPAYIHDGYTQDCYVDGIDRLYPPVRFTFRPVLMPERSILVARSRELELSAPDKAEALTAKVMAEHIIAWDIVDREKKDVRVTPAECLHLQPSLFQRLRNIVVLGLDGGDSDPEKADKLIADPQSDLDEILANAIGEDADSKNSQKG